MRRTGLLRRVALGLAVLLAVLQGAPYRDVGKPPARASAQQALLAAWVDLCAPAQDSAPAKPCHGSVGACCLACEGDASPVPVPRLGDLVTSLASMGRAPLEGRRLRVASVASGWRSSWSAQAPPSFS